MNKLSIERIVEANTLWLEGPGQSADPAEYASVAASTAQLVQALQDEKETAGGSAVERDAIEIRILNVLPESLDKLPGSIVRRMTSLLADLSIRERNLNL